MLPLFHRVGAGFFIGSVENMCRRHVSHSRSQQQKKKINAVLSTLVTLQSPRASSDSTGGALRHCGLLTGACARNCLADVKVGSMTNFRTDRGKKLPNRRDSGVIKLRKPVTHVHRLASGERLA